jgi:hypothetical protein
MRLFLVGDDDALDILAELSRHLDYFEVSRSDELPPSAGADDHVIIGLYDEQRGRALLGRLLADSSPGFADVLSEGDTPGARAILIAAELIKKQRV